KLAGATLESDFYGVVLEGLKGGTTLWTVLNAFVKHFGGDIFDAEGPPPGPEGIKGGATLCPVLNAFVKNFGGDIFHAEGRPTVNRPENVAGVKFWADLWKFSPPGQAEYSLIDVPTVMGNGIAAQTLAWSDFVLGIDQPGKSKLAGKFVYAGSPGTRHAQAR